MKTTQQKHVEFGALIDADDDDDSSDEDAEFVKSLMNIKNTSKDTERNISPNKLTLPTQSNKYICHQNTSKSPITTINNTISPINRNTSTDFGASFVNTHSMGMTKNLSIERVSPQPKQTPQHKVKEYLSRASIGKQKQPNPLNIDDFQMNRGSITSSAEPTKKSGKDNSNKSCRQKPSKDTNNLQQDCEGEGEEEMNQIPYWAQKQKCKDSEKRSPSDSNYDPTTLFIPPDELRKLSSSQKQYWMIKSKHFDKIVFFKLGKFYVMWYEDALIGQKVLDLQLTSGKLSCGFPEKSIDKYAAILVKFGYKIVVVEQVSRNKNKSSVVDREIVDIITRGTINFTFEEQNHDPKNLVVIRQRTNREFGIAVYESFTGKIQVGELHDDKTQTRLKTFLCICKPSEIVYDPGNITSEIMKILRSSFFKAQLSILKDNDNQWGPNLAAHYITTQYGNDSTKYPTELQDMRSNEELRGQRIELKYSALAGLFSYMQYTMRLESVLQSGEFIPCDFDKKTFSSHLLLDSQALQHLEILQNSTATTVSDEDNRMGTLINYLDYTKSPYGKRLMKKWVCSPLTDIAAIEDRLDALEDINNDIAMKEKFVNGISKFPDIERLCSSIYRYSVKTKQSGKALMYEDISGVRLNEFKNLINTLKEIEALLESTFILNVSKFKSNRLKRLCSYKTIGDPKKTGDLPKVSEFICALEEYVEFSQNERIGMSNVQHPIPKQGVNAQYDQIRENIRNIEGQLQEYLETLQNQFGSVEITYVFQSNRQYDIEIPKKVLERIKTRLPKEFTLQSATSSAQRFTTPYVAQLVARIEELQADIKPILVEFSVAVFGQFFQQKEVWDKFVSIVAELDCLVSLSHASFTVADGVMCRPVIKFAKSQKETFFNLKQGRNPNLSQLGGNQIPNDIQMGNINTEKSKPTIMILTGPNMGGKSTTLRLFCSMAIIAQIGCYVPAQVCEFSLVDRIFTRIGAGDKLIEGKSTFYIEMEEVKNSLMYGTYNSLAIFDELGRGTSTFDGVAIAYGILKYFIEKVQSRCIFATHFFLLINELRFYKEISFFHMEYFYDKKTQKLIFKYKLKSGNADSSFGIELAKIVGIEDSILKRSEEKRNEFESSMQYGEVYQQQKLTQYNGLISKLFTYENRHK